MGCLHSCAKPKKFDCVRVVHINGYVEDYDGPVTASQVMGKPGRNVLCCSSHLLYSGKHAFKPEDPLEPGRIYFLLPMSVFQSEASPVDLACLMNRLTSLARKGGSGAKGPSVIDSLLGQAEKESPSQASACAGAGSCEGQTEVSPAPGPEFATWRSKQGSRSAWKPCLDRIDESFRRSMRTDSVLSNESCELQIDNVKEFRNKSGNNIGVVS
ncbi:hypothetical protein LUZ62_089115 [Rhynchospora pubera]|uniref:Uncharacterized protein n=1 Tax=Rhynchospora pubera TaxID=906938 RepID=A0AAV8CIV3_9POAL|nr:hypothetical protein LUZ62_089115 [Rhynchospora pubera]